MVVGFDLILVNNYSKYIQFICGTIGKSFICKINMTIFGVLNLFVEKHKAYRK